jgi:hypothetical protein
MTSLYKEKGSVKLRIKSSSKIICKNAVPTWQELQFVFITKTTRWILCGQKSGFIPKGKINASCGKTESFSMSKQPAAKNYHSALQSYTFNSWGIQPNKKRAFGTCYASRDRNKNVSIHTIFQTHYQTEESVLWKLLWWHIPLSAKTSVSEQNHSSLHTRRSVMCCGHTFNMRRWINRLGVCIV